MLEASRPIVIFGNEGWETDAPTNKHQLARRFARSTSVIYVSAGGRSARAGLRPVVATRCDASGVIVTETLGVPERARQRLPAFGTAQDWIAVHAARRALARCPRGSVAAIVYFPMALKALRSLGAGTLVYDCVDHHASVPEWERQAGTLLRKEEQLVRAADLVLASSRPLADHCRQWRSDAKLLENVGDVELFSQASGGRQKQGAVGRRPLVFFHGTFSVRKIDFAALRAVADCVPAVDVRLVGNAVDARSEWQLRALAARSNVEWLPGVGQSRIVELLQEADVLVMPYAINAHTAHVFPLKLVEYLATGKPILTSRLQSVADVCGDAVAYMHTGDDIGTAVRGLLQEENATRARRRALAAGRTWDARASEIMRLLDAQLT